MRDNCSSFNRNNRWVSNTSRRNSNISYNENYTPFFGESSEKKTKRIESHHAELLKVYERWYNYELPIIDLDTFDPQYLKLSPLGQGEILKEYALSHLKYYKNASKKYECISKLYDKFNTEIKEFQDETREHLRKILGLGRNNDYNLNQLMRLYLYMITCHHKKNETLDRIPIIEYGYNENPVFSDLSLANPFRSKENEIIQDLKARKDEIINQIDKLVAIKELLESELTDLKNMLKPIIINKGLGLKGKCDFEEEIGTLSKIKHIFRRHRNVP